MDLFEGIIGIIITWLIFFPLLLVVGTPLILIISTFGKNGSYFGRVSNGYCDVYNWWEDYGLWWLC